MSRGLVPLRWAAGRVLPRVVRPRRHQVCFASVPDFSDSAYAQYRHLLENRSNLHFVWLLHDLDLRARVVRHFEEAAGDRGHSLRVVDWSRPVAYYEYLRSSVVFHTHGAFNFSRSSAGRCVVSLWHGMPIKVIYRLAPKGEWHHDVSGDIHIASSRMYQCVIAAAFGVDVQSVLLSGLPRADVLKGRVAPERDKSTVCSVLGVDPTRELVVWLPTHRRDDPARPRRSFADDVDATLLTHLLDACAHRNQHVVVKPHPYDELVGSAIEQFSQHPALTIVSNQAWKASALQLYDLVAAASGLVTDISSILVDYLHTGRPLGTFAFDEETYGRETVVPIGPLLRSAAVTHLADHASVDDFVSRVAAGEVVELPRRDIGSWLVEDGDIDSCETIANAAGL